MISLEGGTALALLLAIIAASVGYGKLQGKIEQLTSEVAALWKVINGMRTETQAHYKESDTVRRELEKEIREVREIAIRNDGRWEEVLRRFDSVDEKLDKLEGGG